MELAASGALVPDLVAADLITCHREQSAVHPKRPLLSDGPRGWLGDHPTGSLPAA